MVTSKCINLPSIKLGYAKKIHDRMCTISLYECCKVDVTLIGDTDITHSRTGENIHIREL